MAKVGVVSQTRLTKQCYRCGITKDTSEFHRSARKPDSLQIYCRACKKEFDRQNYIKHPRNNYARNKAKSHSNRVWLYKLLVIRKCEWEGCAVSDPDMLVFDHIDPKDKRLEISRMVQRAYSIKTIEEEISKCRVLCANHHLKHTIQQFGCRRGNLIEREHPLETHYSAIRLPKMDVGNLAHWLRII